MASSLAGKNKKELTKVQWNNFADFATLAQKKYYDTYGVIPDDYVEPTAAQTQALARGQYSAAYANQGKATTSNSLAGKTAKDLTRVEVYDFLQNATPEEKDYYYGHHTNEKGEEVANGIPDSYVPKQNYTFWNAGNSTIGDYGIDDSNSDTWKRIQALYNSGDVNGAYDLINGMAGKGQFGGYYDDNGQYWGFAQGYLGGANSSYLPVVGGKILSNKGLDTTGTNIWLTPDGKALHADANGALTDTGDTWSRYGNSDIARAQLKALDDADASLQAFREQNGGRYPEAPDPVPNGNGGLTYSYGGGNNGGSQKQQSTTPYQQVLNSYNGTAAGNYTPTQPVSYQEYLNQNGGGKPASLSAPSAYDPNSDTLWQQYLKEYGNAKAPEYAGDPYQAQRDQYLQNAANMEWNYNPDTDPVWQAYQKQYRREGQRATEDTLGRYAAMTGGMPSTAAVTAASQAGDYYASQLSDKLPEVYQQAYQRYLQEYQRQLGLSDAYNQYGQLDYQKYLDQLGQFNKDRNFAYGAARDNQSLGRQQTEDQYKRYLDALSQANYEDETAYNRYRDTISDQRYDQEWAQKLRAYADEQNWKTTEWQQYLREYGDKLSQTEKEWAWEQAQQAAKYGDYSGLEGMGIDTSSANPKEVAYAADGSMYKFNTQDALYFVKNAPNSTPGNPTTMTGSDGSTWKKDEYGNVTITTKNGKVFTYNNNKPAVTGSGKYSGGGKGSGGGGETYSTSTVNAAYKAYLNGDRSDLTLRILQSAGLVEPGGIPDEGDPESEYALMDRVLADMQAQGRPWNQLQVELDAELRDERITREEYEALRQKYVSRGLEDGVANLDGVVHRNGSPMSAGFTGVWRTVRDLADRQKKEEALAAMRRAYEAGTIHEYEIDVMMDQLGW